MRPLAPDRLSAHRVVRAAAPQPRAPLPAPREPLPEPLEDDRRAEQHGPGASGAVSYHRPGIQVRVLRRLRRGHYRIEDELDLHGLTGAEAGRHLDRFLDDCQERGVGCVLIVHGKGRGSPGSKPFLKAHLTRWLRAREEVAAFCSARPADGGTGAVYALLRRRPRAKRGSR